jgi:hypothetical protein
MPVLPMSMLDPLISGAEWPLWVVGRYGQAASDLFRASKC